MPELPRISGAQAIKVLGRLGFKVVRQKGSHVVLRNLDKGCVIPLHHELAIGTLRSAIKQASLSVAEFVDAYRER